MGRRRGIGRMGLGFLERLEELRVGRSVFVVFWRESELFWWSGEWRE
jgi:hypothetical protein